MAKKKEVPEVNTTPPVDPGECDDCKNYCDENSSNIYLRCRTSDDFDNQRKYCDPDCYEEFDRGDMDECSFCYWHGWHPPIPLNALKLNVRYGGQ